MHDLLVPSLHSYRRNDAHLARYVQYGDQAPGSTFRDLI